LRSIDTSTNLPLLPPNFSVIRALKDWLDSRRSDGGTEGGHPATDALRKLDAAAEAERKIGTEVGLPTMKPLVIEDLEYWNRVADTIPPEKIRVWKALERALGDYKGILSMRAKLMDDCTGLEAENEELRRTLAAYMSPTFQNMQVPPAHTVKLGPAAAASLAISSGELVGLRPSPSSAGPLYRPDAHQRTVHSARSNHQNKPTASRGTTATRQQFVGSDDDLTSLSLISSPPPRSSAARPT
jgi:hypothetical protein